MLYPSSLQICQNKINLLRYVSSQNTKVLFAISTCDKNFGYETAVNKLRTNPGK